jgi:hypothetical protein
MVLLIMIYTWSSWYDAIRWAAKYANADCSLLVSDWFASYTAILKYDYYTGNVFCSGKLEEHVSA